MGEWQERVAEANRPWAPTRPRVSHLTPPPEGRGQTIRRSQGRLCYASR